MIDVEIRYTNTKEEKATGIPHYLRITVSGHATGKGAEAGEPATYHEAICASVTTLCTAVAERLKGSVEQFNETKWCQLVKGRFEYYTSGKRFDLERDTTLDVLVWGLWWLYRNYKPYFGKFDISRDE